MKVKDLILKIKENLKSKQEFLCQKILENPSQFFIYKNNNFFPLEKLEEREDIFGLLKNREISHIIFDKISKENVERYGTTISVYDEQGAIIINSILKGIITFVQKDILIVDSVVEGNTTKLLHTLFLDKSYISETSISEAYIDYSYVTGSNIHSVIMEPGSLVNSYCYLANGVLLKKKAMIGPNCNLIINTFGSHRPLEYYEKYSDTKEDEVLEIGEYTWIGAAVNIVKSLKIGDWSIISAGSVISKDILEFSLVTGKEQKSILNKFEKKFDNEDFLEKVLALDYPVTRPLQPQGNIYTETKNKLLGIEDAKEYLKIFYIFIYSNFVIQNKKIVINNFHTFEFKYCDISEPIFEFYTPDFIDICFEENRIKFTYEKNYELISGERIKFLKLLCSFGKFYSVSDVEFICEISENVVEKIIEIDEIFNKEILEEIKRNGIPVEWCNISYGKIKKCEEKR